VKIVRANRGVGITFAAITILALWCQAASGKPAEDAFRKLRALAGDWSGKDAEGNVVKTRFAPIASSTAVMETLTMPGMDDMVTIYSLDVNSIALTHYCPTNNQPRMRAIPPAGDIKELTFAFLGAGNLPDPSIGHENKLVIEFQDKDHITERWTWRRAGKDTESVFRFVREQVSHK
jgi:hypothetical protein